MFVMFDEIIRPTFVRRLDISSHNTVIGDKNEKKPSSSQRRQDVLRSINYLLPVIVLVNLLAKRLKSRFFLKDDDVLMNFSLISLRAWIFKKCTLLSQKSQKA